MVIHHAMAKKSGLNEKLIRSLFADEIEPAYRLVIETCTQAARDAGLGHRKLDAELLHDLVDPTVVADVARDGAAGARHDVALEDGHRGGVAGGRDVRQHQVRAALGEVPRRRRDRRVRERPRERRRGDGHGRPPGAGRVDRGLVRREICRRLHRAAS